MIFWIQKNGVDNWVETDSPFELVASWLYGEHYVKARRSTALAFALGALTRKIGKAWNLRELEGKTLEKIDGSEKVLICGVE